MKVSNHIVTVVQCHVAEVEAQRQTGQTADTEHRQEGQREQHRGVEADRTAPKRHEQARPDNHRRDGDE